MNDERLAIINLTNAEKIGLGKKYALQKGIEAAKNELILLTDADCQPLSKNWIREMAGCVNDKHKIVLGISPYKTENTILNSLIEYETAQTALQYVGFALLKNPYMSVGRNVLYDAALLKSKIWTTQELSIASGDDDLTIQTLATKENTTVCLSKDSYTVSKAKDSWSAWIQQKLRHYESGSMYRFSHRLFLGSYLFKKMILYSVLLFFICNGFKIFFTIPSASSFFLKCCFYAPCFFMLFCICFTFFINYILNKKLQLNKRWYFAVFNDLLYCIFTIMLGLISQFKTTKNWK